MRARERLLDAYCAEVGDYALGCRKAGAGLWPPLFVALFEKHVDVTAMLIAAGADVNAAVT